MMRFTPYEKISIKVVCDNNVVRLVDAVTTKNNVRSFFASLKLTFASIAFRFGCASSSSTAQHYE